jgi:hypothetical protein
MISDPATEELRCHIYGPVLSAMYCPQPLRKDLFRLRLKSAGTKIITRKRRKVKIYRSALLFNSFIGPKNEKTVKHLD